MNHPRTSALIEHIRKRDGQVGIGLGNAPEEWVKLARELEDELAAMKAIIGLAVDCGEVCGMDGAYPDAREQMKAVAASGPLPAEAALRELRQYVMREISEARLRMDIYIVHGSTKQLKFTRGQEDALVGVYNRIKELLCAETPSSDARAVIADPLAK